MEFVEHRIEPRESLALPLDVGSLRGVTRDISPSGMYIQVAGHHDFGGVLHFEMQLDEANIKFTAEGRIVRVEHRDGLTGIAVRLVSPRLTPLD